MNVRNPNGSTPQSERDLTIDRASASSQIGCPLCLGVGNLKRTEILDRLGVKDFARVA